MDDFEELLRRRLEASRAWARGDPGPLLDMTATEGPATFLDPGGRVTTGAEGLRAAFREGARAFGPRTTTEVALLDSGAEGGLGWWTGIQTAEADLGEGDLVPMRLRITEVFRRGPEGWRLVHRHASEAAEEEEGEDGGS